MIFPSGSAIINNGFMWVMVGFDPGIFSSFVFALIDR